MTYIPAGFASTATTIAQQNNTNADIPHMAETHKNALITNRNMKII